MTPPTPPHPLPAPLATEQFLGDPRVAQARELLLAALADHQRPVTAVRPADPARKVAYDALLKGIGEARGGGLYFPYLGSGFGAGPFVELADGSVKFDMISGIGVHHFGHSNPLLVSAALQAALRDTIMQGNLQQNVESVALATTLLARAAPMAHCFFTTSGAMANENALKLAFHKKPSSTRILAFEHAFAGRTMALSCVTDKAAYRVGVPIVLPVDYIPFFDATRPEESIARAVAVLKSHLARFPNQHAALWCEFVQGEGGFYPGTRDFFAALFQEARNAKIAVVADEVQTFGRTSRLFAFQHFNLEEFIDITTVGKMLQLCATLFTDPFKPGPGLLSQTFTGSTSAIVAAHTILQNLLTDDIFGPTGRNLQVNARFVHNFNAIATRHPNWIRGPHGIGGMIAFTALDGTDDQVKKLLRALFDNGVIAFYNGQNPTRLRFLPPVPAITDAHIDSVCGILESTLAQIAAA